MYYLFRVFFIFYLSLLNYQLAAEKAPNIILIMADDLGYEGLSCNGSLDYTTPQLDKLASKGIRFRHCYSLPICTPSRVKLMTGRYSYRNYERFGLLPEGEISFGNLMRNAGYRTCIVGKWQLGGDWSTPHGFGFDDYCLMNGILPKKTFDRNTRGKSRYWGNPVIVSNGNLLESKHSYGPETLNEYAINFIKQSKGQPFFLYYPMVLTHSPFEPSPNTPGEIGKDGKTSEVRYFKEMVEYMDHLVGNLVKALDSSEQRVNTLILFTADNGTTYPVKVTASSSDMMRMATNSGRVGRLYHPGEQSPIAKSSQSGYIEGPITRTTYGKIPGGKDLMNEYGTHVPLVVSWPRFRDSYRAFGNVCDDLIDFSDFFVTIAELAASALPSDREIDGISFARRLRGEGASPRKFIFCHYWHFGRDSKRAKEAIHNGKWKLYNNKSFYNFKDDLEEKKPIPMDALKGTSLAAYHRLSSQYRKLRKLDLPNSAPNRMCFDEASSEEEKLVTLSVQLAHAKARSEATGKPFNAERTKKYFNAKDLNKDGFLDEAEQAKKAEKGWNKSRF